MPSLLGFLSSVLGPIIRPLIREEIQELKDWLKSNNIAHAKIESIGIEAGELMGELDAAETPTEIKAILRKVANFSDVSKLLLLRDT